MGLRQSSHRGQTIKQYLPQQVEQTTRTNGSYRKKSSTGKCMANLLYCNKNGRFVSITCNSDEELVAATRARFKQEDYMPVNEELLVMRVERSYQVEISLKCHSPLEYHLVPTSESFPSEELLTTGYVTENFDLRPIPRKSCQLEMEYSMETRSYQADEGNAAKPRMLAHKIIRISWKHRSKKEPTLHVLSVANASIYHEVEESAAEGMGLFPRVLKRSKEVLTPRIAARHQRRQSDDCEHILHSLSKVEENIQQNIAEMDKLLVELGERRMADKQKSEHLIKFSEAYLRIGEYEKAEQTANESIRLLENVTDRGQKCQALFKSACCSGEANLGLLNQRKSVEYLEIAVDIFKDLPETTKGWEDMLKRVENLRKKIGRIRSTSA